MRMGWGAVLRGEPTDLEDWRYVLGSGFDPWTEMHGEDTILRSGSFDTLSSAAELRIKALDLIDYLNGALAISQSAHPVSFGGAIEFTQDGRLNRSVFAEGVVLLSRLKVRATATVLDNDGNPIPSVPRASEVQVWAATAEADDLLQEALVYVGKESTWFNIYKALECLELRFGGGEAEFLQLGWAPASQIKLMKRSANVLRHAKQKFDPPERPMPLDDATSLLRSLIRRGLQEASAIQQEEGSDR